MEDSQSKRDFYNHEMMADFSFSLIGQIAETRSGQKGEQGHDA